MGSIVNSDDFIPGQGIRFGTLDFVIDSAGHLALATSFIEGHAFCFRSLDFIDDRIGRLHIRDSFLEQLVQTLTRQPLENDYESASQLITMVDSLLPIFDSSSERYESSNSYNPPREVFMANSGTCKGRATDDDADDVLGMPTTNKTPES